jgi:hypothetical protein
MQFLLEYRRSTGKLLSCVDLGSDRPLAMAKRFERERAHNADQDVEVVLLTASSADALKRTHARYFKSVPELAAELLRAVSPG